MSLQPSESNYNFKVVLLGEGCVGKTSLVLRYVEDKFNTKHISTLQASFLNKKINVDGRTVRMALWDTAGQEKFHALGPIYYRSSNGAILVYDITDEDSFQKVKKWIKELKKMLGADITLAIVGNKIDLERDRHVDPEMAQSYADGVGATHYETSAKNNVGVEEVFVGLTKQMVAVQEAKRAADPTLNRSNSVRRSNRIIVAASEDDAEADDAPQAAPAGRCCGGSA